MQKGDFIFEIIGCNAGGYAAAMHMCPELRSSLQLSKHGSNLIGPVCNTKQLAREACAEKFVTGALVEYHHLLIKNGIEKKRKRDLSVHEDHEVEERKVR